MGCIILWATKILKQQMTIPKKYQPDIRAILEKRYDNGADFWATSAGRWGTGSPFSTFDCILMLSELGMRHSNPVLSGAAEQILSAWQEDGRFRPASKGTIYPCYAANAARVLYRIGYVQDSRLKRTFQHLLEIRHSDGGWRCNTVKLSGSPETDASNTGTMLAALDAFRFSPFLNRDKRLDRAVLFLLDHWETRRPLSPCLYGIGTLFMKVEYPFFRYNVFFYVYVLSFYNAAKKNNSFQEALHTLESKLIDGKVMVENPNRKLIQFAFCKKGEPSDLATRRYHEILKNIA